MSWEEIDRSVICIPNSSCRANKNLLSRAGMLQNADRFLVGDGILVEALRDLVRARHEEVDVEAGWDFF
jgi:hypothetical protein